MPYNFVIEGSLYEGEREVTYVDFNRPISFKEKLRIGKREYGLFGTREVEVEIFSHDKAKVTALRDTNLELTVHEKNPDEKKTVDKNVAAVRKEVIFPEDNKKLLIELKKGTVLDLYKTSFIIDGRSNEQVVWSPSMDGISDF